MKNATEEKLHGVRVVTCKIFPRKLIFYSPSLKINSGHLHAVGRNRNLEKRNSLKMSL